MQKDPTLKRDSIPKTADLKAAFNSPFWPFVLTTTSIGTEGIDLHWYARNVVHWTVPDRPIDLEQREGRVLRYRCHAYRLNEALIDGNHEAYRSQSVKTGWEKSDMYECQLNFFSPVEYDGANGGCYHVRRYVYFPMQTAQNQFYDHCLDVISHYRRIIGQEVWSFADVEHLPEEPLCLSPWLSREKTSPTNSPSASIPTSAD